MVSSSPYSCHVSLNYVKFNMQNVQPKGKNRFPVNKEKLFQALPMFLVNASTCQFHPESRALLNTFFGFVFVCCGFLHLPRAILMLLLCFAHLSGEAVVH